MQTYKDVLEACVNGLKSIEEYMHYVKANNPTYMTSEYVAQIFQFFSEELINLFWKETITLIKQNICKELERTQRTTDYEALGCSPPTTNFKIGVN